MSLKAWPYTYAHMEKGLKDSGSRDARKTRQRVQTQSLLVLVMGGRGDHAEGGKKVIGGRSIRSRQITGRPDHVRSTSIE